MEPWPLALDGVSDRPVFWAELALVSSPALLSRLGALVSARAGDDGELAASVRKAAAHVRSQCCVWAPYGGGTPDVAGMLPSHGDGAEAALVPENFAPVFPGSARGRPSGDAVTAAVWNTPKSVETDYEFLLSLAAAPVSGLTLSTPDVDDDNDASESSEDSSGCADPWHALLPPRVLYYAPGLGHPTSQIFWVLGLAAGLTQKVLVMVFDGSWHRWLLPLRSSWCTTYVGLLTVVYTLGKLKVNQTLCTALTQHFTWEMARRARAYAATVLVLLILLSFSWHQFGGPSDNRSPWWLQVIIAINWVCMAVVLAMALLVFHSVVSLTTHLQDGLKRRVVALGLAGESACSWEELTRQTHALQAVIADIWKPSEMGVLVITLLLTNLIAGCIFLINFLVQDERRAQLLVFSLACVFGSVVVMMVYLPALISSKWSSLRPSRDSILANVLRYYGNVPREQRLDHHLCAANLSCSRLGVEVKPIGIITMGFALFVSRVICAVVPVILALGLSQFEQRRGEGGPDAHSTLAERMSPNLCLKYCPG